MTPDNKAVGCPGVRQIARGAGIVMAGFALSSLIGLLNRMLYSGVFGTGVSLDAFFSANRVPDILFNLMAGGALASAFIPMFATLLTQNNRPGAWRLASGIGNLLILGLSLAAALVWIAAPWIVPNLLVPGYDDPVAAFVAGQHHTFPFYKLARQGHWRIPDDIAVVGFDDDTNEAEILPALTTVAQPHKVVGREAVRLLLAGLEGRSISNQARLIPPHLVIRDSCG